MSCAPSALDHLSDRRDQLLFAQTPLYPMPRFGELPLLDLRRRRYIAAADGVYVQARHCALDLTLRLAEARLPYGSLKECVHLPGGPIPRALYEDIKQRVLEHSPKEWAGLVHWDESAQRYSLAVPPTLSRSVSHIGYDRRVIDYSRLVLDVHSHGEHAAFFSSTDDRSDEFGFYFSSVFGHCGSTETLTVCTRLVIDGHFFDLSWHPWEEE